MLLIQIERKDDREADVLGRPADMKILTEQGDISSLVYWVVKLGNLILAEEIAKKELSINSTKANCIHLHKQFYLLLPENL